jgi:RHS repeat-associated protein
MPTPSSAGVFKVMPTPSSAGVFKVVPTPSSAVVPATITATNPNTPAAGQFLDEYSIAQSSVLISQSSVPTSQSSVPSDANFNVTGVVGTTGTMLQHQVYDAYGTVQWKNAAFDNISGDAYTLKNLYQGMLYNEAIGWYYSGQSNDGRWYSPTLKVWNRPDIGPIDGLNLYPFVQDNPINRVDWSGLWGSNVHDTGYALGNTELWATGLGYPIAAAQAIGKADAAVDDIWGGSIGPAPWKGDQGYHFNVPMAGSPGMDSRMVHEHDHLFEAKKAAVRCNDDPITAAKELGTALHPYQDWVAHGDFALGGTTVIHNSHSPQTPLPGKPDLSSYPDDPELDAIGSPDGRPAGAAMRTVTEYWGIRTYDFALFTKGNKRITLTKSMTEDVLDNFLDFVRKGGGPKAKKYFL